MQSGRSQTNCSNPLHLFEPKVSPSAVDEIHRQAATSTLGRVFIWFGGRKVIGRSPVSALVAQTLPFGSHQLIVTVSDELALRRCVAA